MEDVKKLFGDAAETAVTESDAKEAGVSTAEAKVVLAQYEEKCANDPSLKERAFALSESVVLLKTLGTNSKDAEIAASIVVNKEETKKNYEALVAKLTPAYVEQGMTQEEAVEAAKAEIKAGVDSSDKATKKKYSYRKIESTHGICGYIFKNVGTTPIKYLSQKCTKGADGKWTVEKVYAEAAPNTEFIMTRTAAIILGTSPEFSFKFANARITAKNKKDVNQYLKSSYLTFLNKGKTVHDEDVKIVIDKEDADGNIVVNKKYADVFGYLENKVEKPAKEKAAPKTQEEKKAASNLLQAAIADQLFSKINNI